MSESTKSGGQPPPTGWGTFKSLLGSFVETVTELPGMGQYQYASYGVADRLNALPTLDATPPHLKDPRKAVDTAEAKRAKAIDVPKPDYAKGTEAAYELDAAINTFTSGYQTHLDDKDAYEKHYAGLKDKVDALPAADTLSAPVKKRRLAIDPLEAQRADLVQASKQDYAAAKDVALNLKKAVADYENSADVETKLKADPIEKAKLKELVGKEGGTAALDEMIANLDESSDKRVVRAALEVRFGVTITMEGEKDTKEVANNSFKRIYALMTKVPDKHVRDSLSLKTINRSETQGTSSYESDTKQINLRMDRDNDATNDTYLRGRLTNDSGLPTRDAGCEPENADTVKSFDWTTLHEVGHAVDDSKNYMGLNGKALAGWKNLTVDQVATAAAGHLSFAASYIKAYLQGGEGSTPDVPAKPKNKSDEQWENLRKAACEWCDAIRSTKKLWYNQGECAARKIGDVVYQESYPGFFNCYEFSARSKGLRGYSFRASGEWFADMYAGYYVDPRVMKASHPCFEMIKNL